MDQGTNVVLFDGLTIPQEAVYKNNPLWHHKSCSNSKFHSAYENDFKKFIKTQLSAKDEKDLLRESLSNEENSCVPTNCLSYNRKTTVPDLCKFSDTDITKSSKDRVAHPNNNVSETWGEKSTHNSHDDNSYSNIDNRITLPEDAYICKVDPSKLKLTDIDYVRAKCKWYGKDVYEYESSPKVRERIRYLEILTQCFSLKDFEKTEYCYRDPYYTTSIEDSNAGVIDDFESCSFHINIKDVSEKECNDVTKLRSSFTNLTPRTKSNIFSPVASDVNQYIYYCNLPNNHMGNSLNSGDSKINNFSMKKFFLPENSSSSLVKKISAQETGLPKKNVGTSVSVGNNKLKRSCFTAKNREDKFNQWKSENKDKSCSLNLNEKMVNNNFLKKKPLDCHSEMSDSYGKQTKTIKQLQPFKQKEESKEVTVISLKSEKYNNNHDKNVSKCLSKFEDKETQYQPQSGPVIDREVIKSKSKTLLNKLKDPMPPKNSVLNEKVFESTSQDTSVSSQSSSDYNCKEENSSLIRGSNTTFSVKSNCDESQTDNSSLSSYLNIGVKKNPKKAQRADFGPSVSFNIYDEFDKHLLKNYSSKKQDKQKIISRSSKRVKTNKKKPKDRKVDSKTKHGNLNNDTESKVSDSSFSSFSSEGVASEKIFNQYFLKQFLVSLLKSDEIEKIKLSKKHSINSSDTDENIVGSSNSSKLSAKSDISVEERNSSDNSVEITPPEIINKEINDLNEEVNKTESKSAIVFDDKVVNYAHSLRGDENLSYCGKQTEINISRRVSDSFIRKTALDTNDNQGKMIDQPEIINENLFSQINFTVTSSSDLQKVCEDCTSTQSAAVNKHKQLQPLIGSKNLSEETKILVKKSPSENSAVSSSASSESISSLKQIKKSKKVARKKEVKEEICGDLEKNDNVKVPREKRERKHAKKNTEQNVYFSCWKRYCAII